jgi:hypothetical protein
MAGSKKAEATAKPEKTDKKPTSKTVEKKVVKKKAADAVKRNMNPYMFFVKDFRIEHATDGLKGPDLVRAAGAAWGVLGDKSVSRLPFSACTRFCPLQKYEKLAAEDKARYERESAKGSE